jgi:hypothetical protein
MTSSLLRITARNRSAWTYRAARDVSGGMRKSAAIAGLSVAATLFAAAATGRPPGQSPAPLRATPRALLSLCRSNSLLRSACPTSVPASGSAPATRGFYCMTRNRRESVRDSVKLFRSNRCVFAEWSYEAGQGLPGWTIATRLTGWNGHKWVADEWSMLSPPLHVGVDVQASLRNSPQGVTSAVVPWPHATIDASDQLLGPTRRAVSLGWVNWYGRRGQLVLTPYGPCESGNELIFYMPPNRRGVSYAIRLDAWMATVHIRGKRVNRVLEFQAGPALPHVIATLKAIVGSAFT